MGQADPEIDVVRQEAEAEEARVRLAELRVRALAAERRSLMQRNRIAALKDGVSGSQKTRSVLSIAGAASLIAAALPVATFVHGWVQKDRDVALAREKQLESARMAYLDRLKDVDGRERVLRFIQQTSTDSKMLAWAADEQKRVGATQVAIITEIQALAQKVNSNQDHDAVKSAERRIAELETRLGKPSGVPINKPAAGDSNRASLAPPPSPDASLPEVPPGRTRGVVPTIAGECTQWSPPTDLAPGKCRVACWDAGQRSKYNVLETKSSPSQSECATAALARCQKAENSFCSYAWAAPVSAALLAGRSVSCDRATQNTLARLNAADQSKANAYCAALASVVATPNSTPHLWPDGNGVSFDSGHQVGGESVWCSCFLSGS